MELKNVEVFDNEIKMTFMYTNRTRDQQYARPNIRSELVDDRGNRYPYASASLKTNQWPPQIPVEFWLSFAKATPGASSISLNLSWYIPSVTGEGNVARGMSSDVGITFRRIPLPAAPAAAQGFRYSHQLFPIELRSVEVVNDGVRINLTYTNRTSRPQYSGIAAGSAYLVDNLGKRYKYISDSFSQTRKDFPPQDPEEIWITFDKLQPGSSSLNLILPWRARDAEPVSVTFRGIQLPQ